jgi:hypothetical protein
MARITRIGCRCGQVHLEVEAAPIIGTECHCSSCREAGQRLRALPVNDEMLEENGGTRFVCYRKDRVRFIQGAGLLREFRLKPESSTRRVLAGCCNTPVFLEFKGGHWLSLYAGLWPEGLAPRMDIRTMTGDRPVGIPLDSALPSGTWPTARFYARLLGAWIAMGFKVPEITVSGGEVHA